MVLPWVYCCHIPYKACRSLKLSSPYLFTFHLQLRLRKLAYIHAARQQHTVLHLTCKKRRAFLYRNRHAVCMEHDKHPFAGTVRFIYSITLASSVELTNCIWPLFSAGVFFAGQSKTAWSLFCRRTARLLFPSRAYICGSRDPVPHRA